MAIVQLKSTNPSFSFIIRKHPGNGMLLRSIRKGMAYGWYTGESAFNVYFKDADNEVSYKRHAQEQFEYLNVSRYNSPQFVLGAINEFFASPFKEQNAQDTEGHEHSCFIHMIHIDRMRYVEFFEKHLPDYRFELVHHAHKSYAFTVTTSKSLHELLHVMSVLCLFLALFSDEYIDISDEILKKYLRSVQIIDAPFYIRSLFARNFLASKERFKRYKSELEVTSRYDRISLDFGGTGQQRRSFIRGILPFDKSIVDVGCGEGFYAIPFASNIEHSYYAIDTNEALLQTVERKAQAKEIANIALFPSLAHYAEAYNGETVDVILTEVIEHMSVEEAEALIRHICEQLAFDHLIITTPNADFNRYYELEAFRHDDHKWEMGTQAFQSWLTKLMEGRELSVEFVAIGEGVNGIQTTQGAMVRRKKR